MSRIKLPADYIRIEDKLTVIPYRTIVFSHHVPNQEPLTEEEYKMLSAVFRIGVMSTLSECVNPNSIAASGDEVLKKNYHTVVRLAEKMGLIEVYDCPEDYKSYEEPDFANEVGQTTQAGDTTWTNVGKAKEPS